jgi:hypothetical protein
MDRSGQKRCFTNFEILKFATTATKPFIWYQYHQAQSSRQFDNIAGFLIAGILDS